MRKIFIPIIVLFLLLSCSNDVQFNSPALQGTKNYNYWRARDIQATLLENGGLRIIGVNIDESLTLILEGSDEGSYILGSNSVNSAIFDGNDLKTYSTSNNGDGEIILEDYDITDLTITGTFKFNSYSGDASVVNFINGVFYKIPIEINILDEATGTNLLNATINSNNAESEDITTLVTDNELLITANYLDNSVIEIHMPKFVTLGSHTLKVSTQIYANYILPDGTLSSSQNGTMQIIEHDLQFKKLKGTFSFNTGAPYNLSVTNGSFIIYY